MDLGSRVSVRTGNQFQVPVSYHLGVRLCYRIEPKAICYDSDW
jgi:hypothetical protein